MLSLSVHSADGGLCFSGFLTFLERVAFVVGLLAASQGNLELDAALLEVGLRYDQRHASSLQLSAQFLDLPSVQQQFTRSLFVVPECGVVQLRDLEPLDPSLTPRIYIDPSVT